jgi:hypothetical protein
MNVTCQISMHYKIIQIPMDYKVIQMPMHYSSFKQIFVDTTAAQIIDTTMLLLMNKRAIFIRWIGSTCGIVQRIFWFLLSLEKLLNFTSKHRWWSKTKEERSRIIGVDQELTNSILNNKWFDFIPRYFFFEQIKNPNINNWTWSVRCQKANARC